MNHYVYLLRSEKYHYIGVRSCECSVEVDRYMGSGVALRSAQKAGVVFEKTVLCVIDSRDEADAMEMLLVTQKQVDDPLCLNLVVGGGSNFGYRHSDETKAKIAAAGRGGKAATGYRHSDETKAKIAAAGRLRKMTDRNKSALSRANTGNNYNVGRECKKETREKISKSLAGKRHTPERRDNSSAARKGVPWSASRRAAHETKKNS